MMNPNLSMSAIETLMTPAIAQAIRERYTSLTEVAQVPLEELQTIPGVGPRKAQQIHAAFELARMLARENALEQPIIDNPERVAALFREDARVYSVETLQLVLLNTRKKLIKIVQLSQGTMDRILVDPKQILREALIGKAAAIALVHNHPSGSPQPSNEDIVTTRNLIRAAQLMHIEVVDHLILGRSTAEHPKDYASLREMGLLFDV